MSSVPLHGSRLWAVLAVAGCLGFALGPLFAFAEVWSDEPLCCCRDGDACATGGCSCRSHGEVGDAAGRCLRPAQEPGTVELPGLFRLRPGVLTLPVETLRTPSLWPASPSPDNPPSAPSLPVETPPPRSGRTV